MRRRAASAPMSLFAFQDIMMATIGVMLFIMLIMAMQLTNVIAAVEIIVTGPEHDPSATPAIAPLDARIKELQQQIAARRQQIDELVDAIGGGDPASLARLRNTLQDLYDEIEQINQEIENLQAELTAFAEFQDQSDSALGDLTILSQQFDALEATLEDERHSRRLIYIAHQRFARRPILVEVSAEVVLVGGTNEAEATVRFDDANPQLRMQQVIGWISAVPPADYYPLILVKPSGIAMAMELRDEFNELGFQTGLDLIPEDKTAILERTDGVR